MLSVLTIVQGVQHTLSPRFFLGYFKMLQYRLWELHGISQIRLVKKSRQKAVNYNFKMKYIEFIIHYYLYNYARRACNSTRLVGTYEEESSQNYFLSTFSEKTSMKT